MTIRRLFDNCVMAMREWEKSRVDNGTAILEWLRESLDRQQEKCGKLKDRNKGGLTWMNIYLHVPVRQKIRAVAALTCPIRLSQVGNTAATSHTRMRH
jgi:hypothetical protein